MKAFYKMFFLVTFLVSLVSCRTWEVGRSFSIINATDAVVSDLNLYNCFNTPEVEESEEPVLSIDALSPQEQSALVYWKLGENTSFGLLPAISTMTLEYYYNELLFEFQFEVATEDSEGCTDITLRSNGIEIVNY